MEVMEMVMMMHGDCDTNWLDQFVKRDFDNFVFRSDADVKHCDG
jgi:hypothetical protein